MTANDSFHWRFSDHYGYHHNNTTEGFLQVRRNNGRWGAVCTDRIPDKKELLQLCEMNLGFNMSGIPYDVLPMSTVAILPVQAGFRLDEKKVWNQLHDAKVASTWGNVECRDPTRTWSSIHTTILYLTCKPGTYFDIQYYNYFIY